MPLRVVTGRGSEPDQPGPVPPAGLGTLGLLGQAWLVGPAAPVTVIDRDAGPLHVSVAAGERGEARFVVENHQAAACLLRPMLSVLTGPGGSRWSPTAEVVPRPLLLLPGEHVEAVMRLDVPVGTPEGTYRGGVVLLGAHHALVEVAIEVTAGDG